MLIDPTREDPLDFIEFRIDGKDDDGKDRWLPHPRRRIDENSTLRAIETIEALGLNRGDWPKFYVERVEVFSADVEAVRDAMATSNHVRVAAAWNRLVNKAFNRIGEYHGLLWDYLHHEFPEAERTRWNLMIPRPGAELGEHASVDLERPSDIDEDLWIEVEALGLRSQTAEEFRAVLVRAIGGTGRTAEWLAEILSREVPTVTTHLRELRAGGRVRNEDELWYAVADNQLEGEG